MKYKPKKSNVEKAIKWSKTRFHVYGRMGEGFDWHLLRKSIKRDEEDHWFTYYSKFWREVKITT